MTNLVALKDALVERGFPELNGVAITVFYARLDDALLEYFPTHRGFAIKVDERMRNAPSAALAGGLAHELAHVLADIRMNRFASMLDGIFYRISFRYRCLDERDTDVEVLLRGFSREFLAFYEYRELLRRPAYSDNGFSMEELRRIVAAQQQTVATAITVTNHATQ